MSFKGEATPGGGGEGSEEEEEQALPIILSLHSGRSHKDDMV